MNRLQAVSLHAAATVLVVGGLLMLLRAAWYPGDLMGLDDATALGALILFVALGLGPLLTFVVFKPRKPGLKADMRVVLAVQILSLAYGLVVAVQSRPVFIVLTDHRAVVIHANEISVDHDGGSGRFPVPLGRFRFVYAQSPDDPQQLQELLDKTLSSGIDIEQQPSFYREIGEIREDTWVGYDKLEAPQVGPNAGTSRCGSHIPAEECAIRALPLFARGAEGVLIIDVVNRRIKDIAPR